MTHENETPDTIAPPVVKSEERENILLNWTIMFVGLGAITLAAVYLPVFL